MLNGLFYISGISIAVHADAWAAFLIENAWKSVALLAAAFAANLALRSASSATRHLLWLATVGALLALPFLTPALPAWRVPLHVLGDQTAAVPRSADEASNLPRKQVGSLAVADFSRLVGRSAAADPLTRWSPWLLFVWAAGFVVAAARLGTGAVWTAWTARRARALESSEAGELLSELARRLRLRRRVRLLEHRSTTVPMTWGILRPTILLPREARTWSLDRLRVVIAHELVHVSRWDSLTQVLAQLASALYWFNPLVWLAAARLRRERERACDDRVLALGTPPSDYAQHLVELARAVRPSERKWSAAVAMAHPSHLEERVVAVLNPRVNRRAITRRASVLAAIAALALVLPVGALRGYAGSEAGKIWGIVYDPSGARVPGAITTLTNLETRSHEVSTTDEEGKFQFTAMPAGHYTLAVEKPGFTSTFQNFSFKADHDRLISIVLSVGRVSQEIIVAGHGTPRSRRPRPIRIRVGGQVEAAKLIAQVRPVYPEDAQQKGIQGTVQLNAVILKDGTVGSLKVINDADSELAQAAVEALKQWRYQPTLLNGEPVEVVTTITVEFNLEPDTKERPAK